jgi:ribosomal-protein-alanine N-acetyltransferase
MHLVTRRLLLRDLTADDAAAFIAYQDDPRYVAFRGGHRVEPRHLLERFARWRDEVPRRHFQLGVFERKPPFPLIGCAGLRDVDRVEGTAELGIELSPDQWGRHRLAIEIAGALLRHGFDRLQLRTIYGITARGNRRVARLAAWFGGECVAATGDEVVWRLARELDEHDRRLRPAEQRGS